ncbi:hypothetical protein J5N97_020982 [Dioscorea zingiberensis]|uniref:Protein TIC 20 n=1 Tax=Dioscorea zingiberensis TaxID=325984 RepID=A0A9D5HE91_9LILI|nr:hypothetical protein J5N97_020982 [Dioscorea zingiberensis]
MAATLALHRFSPLPSLRLLRPSPSLTVHLPLRPRSPPRSSTPPPISMSYRSAVPATDRLVSAASYALPFFNSLHYGRFLFARFPPVAAALEPILPLIAAYRSVPYAAFVVFFALYLGVVRNPQFSRYVRFNAMQAVVLDVLLALPSLIQRVFGVPARGIGFRVLEIGYDALFLFTAACFVYSLMSCVLGKTPYLPLVAAAADRQL